MLLVLITGGNQFIPTSQCASSHSNTSPFPDPLSFFLTPPQVVLTYFVLLVLITVVTSLLQLHNMQLAIITLHPSPPLPFLLPHPKGVILTYFVLLVLITVVTSLLQLHNMHLAIITLHPSPPSLSFFLTPKGVVLTYFVLLVLITVVISLFQLHNVHLTIITLRPSPPLPFLLPHPQGSRPYLFCAIGANNGGSQFIPTSQCASNHSNTSPFACLAPIILVLISPSLLELRTTTILFCHFGNAA